MDLQPSKQKCVRASGASKDVLKYFLGVFLKVPGTHPPGLRSWTRVWSSACSDSWTSPPPRPGWSSCRPSSPPEASAPVKTKGSSRRKLPLKNPGAPPTFCSLLFWSSITRTSSSSFFTFPSTATFSSCSCWRASSSSAMCASISCRRHSGATSAYVTSYFTPSQRIIIRLVI